MKKNRDRRAALQVHNALTCFRACFCSTFSVIALRRSLIIKGQEITEKKIDKGQTTIQYNGRLIGCFRLTDGISQGCG